MTNTPAQDDVPEVLHIIVLHGRVPSALSFANMGEAIASSIAKFFSGGDVFVAHIANSGKIVYVDSKGNPLPDVPVFPPPQTDTPQPQTGPEPTKTMFSGTWQQFFNSILSINKSWFDVLKFTPFVTLTEDQKKTKRATLYDWKPIDDFTELSQSDRAIWIAYCRRFNLAKDA